MWWCGDSQVRCQFAVMQMSSPHLPTASSFGSLMRCYGKLFKKPPYWGRNCKGVSSWGQRYIYIYVYILKLYTYIYKFIYLQPYNIIKNGKLCLQACPQLILFRKESSRFWWQHLLTENHRATRFVSRSSPARWDPQKAENSAGGKAGVDEKLLDGWCCWRIRLSLIQKESGISRIPGWISRNETNMTKKTKWLEVMTKSPFSFLKQNCCWR